MSLISANNLSKEFGPDEIFSGVTIDVPHGARIALVGPNGAGKTTLLNLIVGLDLPSDGTITRARGVRIGFLPQRPELHGYHSVWQELLTAFTDLRAQEAELARLEHELADAQHDAALARYGELQERFELAGGYTYEQRMRTRPARLGLQAGRLRPPADAAFRRAKDARAARSAAARSARPAGAGRADQPPRHRGD